MNYYCFKGNVYSPQPFCFPHLLCADIRVATGTVPAARHWFGVQCCNNPKIFTHAMQQEACNPQMVAHLNSLTGTHLELPLRLEGAEAKKRGG